MARHHGRVWTQHHCRYAGYHHQAHARACYAATLGSTVAVLSSATVMPTFHVFDKMHSAAAFITRCCYELNKTVIALEKNNTREKKRRFWNKILLFVVQFTKQLLPCRHGAQAGPAHRTAHRGRPARRGGAAAAPRSGCCRGRTAGAFALPAPRVWCQAARTISNRDGDILQISMFLHPSVCCSRLPSL